MASPTESESQTQLTNAVHALEELRKFCEVNAGGNWVDLEDTIVQGLESDFATEQLNAVAAVRGQLDGALRLGERVLTPPLRTWGKSVNIPETAATAILSRLFRRMVDVTSDRIQSRQFTFGTPSADSANNGNGSFYRLNTDADGFDIENQHADSKTARCIADAQTGATKNEEVFEVRGQSPGPDSLQVSGSGAVGVLRAQSDRDSLLGNASFAQFSGTTAVPTALTDWTVDTIGNVEIDQTNYYIAGESESTAGSLVFTGDTNVYQALTARNITLESGVPYFYGFAYSRDRESGAAPGSGAQLVARVGTVSRTIDLSTGSGWNFVTVPTTLGQNCWPVNFNENAMDVRFEVSGLGTGEKVWVDHVIFVPMQAFDGSWYTIVGGTTPWLIDDEWTWGDSEVGAILQTWLWRSFGFYLPHATGSAVTIAEP